jgi:hypothetical protein
MRGAEINGIAGTVEVGEQQGVSSSTLRALHLPELPAGKKDQPRQNERNHEDH